MVGSRCAHSGMASKTWLPYCTCAVRCWRCTAAATGEDYVNRSVAGADAFMVPFQELVTEYCWGHVWGRPGISPKTRSMLNLAMLSALGKYNELRLHLRGAVNNGVTEKEIQEVLLHVAIYAGVPASLGAFKVAREVLAELAEEKKKQVRPSAVRRRWIVLSRTCVVGSTCIYSSSESIVQRKRSVRHQNALRKCFV